MRELTYIAPKKLEWRERPDPTLQSRFDAVVKPVAATTCDVDKAIILGRSPVSPPFAIGHECVAEVVDLGDGVTHLEPGDLVVVPWHICCGRCDRCHAGLYAHCRTVPYMAMFGAPIGGSWGGLFSDLVRVPYADTMLVTLTAGLDPVAMAAAGDNYSLAWRLVAPHLASRVQSASCRRLPSSNPQSSFASGGSCTLAPVSATSSSCAPRSRCTRTDPRHGRRKTCSSNTTRIANHHSGAPAPRGNRASGTRRPWRRDARADDEARVGDRRRLLFDEPAIGGQRRHGLAAGGYQARYCVVSEAGRRHEGEAERAAKALAEPRGAPDGPLSACMADARRRRSPVVQSSVTTESDVSAPANDLGLGRRHP
jgi:Alcohol dehydrogenase GroES-like domain